ncbi:MAG: hypothetical protein QW734_11010 [Candidatus Bathyarchaeia archaeon]
MQGSGRDESILTAVVEKGHKPEYRQLYFKASEIRSILGDNDCFFKITVKGKNIVKKYDPERQRYQYMAPSWVGEPGRGIEVKVEKLTEERLVGEILNSLPPHIRVELKHGGEGILQIGKVEFPVKVKKPEWNERHNAVCLDLEFKALSLWGKKVKNHVLRIAYKGYETSMAIDYGETKGTVKEVREEPPGTVAISYVDSEDKVFEHRVKPLD